MATKGTTTRAAIYTRKSSLDERSDDNRSTTAQEDQNKQEIDKTLHGSEWPNWIQYAFPIRPMGGEFTLALGKTH